MPVTIGQVVTYVLPDGRCAGETRPAMVTRVWSPVSVNLHVFLDGTNDAGALEWVASVRHESLVEAPENGGPKLGTWTA